VWCRYRSSAIDIARLRLWLSLIVDEEDFYNIEALPNLDYKIVQGNSLIGIPDGVTVNEEIRNELETLKNDFFKETNEAHKKELRNKINTKIEEQFKFLEPIVGYKIEFDLKLYFSEVWHYNKGFDVVIGNPPYVQMQKDNGQLSKLLKIIGYETFERTGDIYCLFYEKGF
jgi:hypothetical protein